jgi:NADH-quinone oxidoreductase subunit M
MIPYLSLAIWVPIVAGVFVLALNRDRDAAAARWLALVGAIAGFAVTIPLYVHFQLGTSEMQFNEAIEWIPRFNVNYLLGVDGISVLLVLLNSFITVLVVWSAWIVIERKVAQYMAAFLIMSGLTNGVFAALDGLLFYVFFEGMLIPMYLIIGIWGGPNRVYAAIKFFLYTFLGSVLMLVALIYLYSVSGGSFSILEWYQLPLSFKTQLLLFVAFFAAFAVKVPMWPVHTWLPDAHVQAPVAGSMILAGVMLKMGTFGFWRFAIPFFPAATHQARPLLSALAVIGIVYGALMCLAQRDIKKLIAYSSVSHLGYCMLGMLALTAEGATGSAYQMLNHGVSTGALFLLFGFLYERRHTRLMSDYGGIAKVVPVYTASFLIITFSSVAVPGTNGFVGEFLVLLGTFKSSLGLAVGVLAALGVILGAAYMLWMVQKVFFGPLTHRENQHLSDLSLREFATVLPFLLLVAVMGLMPQPFLDRINPSTERFITRANLGAPGSKVQPGDVQITVMGLPPAGMAAAPTAQPSGQLADRR